MMQQQMLFEKKTLTMKGAFGIPRGFFSSENTALILGGMMI